MRETSNTTASFVDSAVPGLRQGLFDMYNSSQVSSAKARWHTKVVAIALSIKRWVLARSNTLVARLQHAQLAGRFWGDRNSAVNKCNPGNVPRRRSRRQGGAAAQPQADGDAAARAVRGRGVAAAQPARHAHRRTRRPRGRETHREDHRRCYSYTNPQANPNLDPNPDPNPFQTACTNSSRGNVTVSRFAPVTVPGTPHEAFSVRVVLTKCARPATRLRCPSTA